MAVMSKSGKPLHHHLVDYFLPHQRNGYRPHLFSVTSVAVLVFAIVILEAGYLVQTKLVFLKTDFLASVLPGALVVLTNGDRQAGGIGGVTEDPLLDTAAQAAADDMAAKGYFAHVSPEGKTPWYWLDSVGYQYSYAGQNLAVNFTDSQNVETAWMNSPTHRANIEKPQYTRVGIGVASGAYEGRDTTFVVQFFATPAEPAAPETPAPASVALAKPAPRESASSTEPVKVLGAAVESASAVPVLHPVMLPRWLAPQLASPLSLLEAILTFLFAIIAISFAAAVFIKGKSQHRSVYIGGAILFACIAAALLISIMSAGPVSVLNGEQAASTAATPAY